MKFIVAAVLTALLAFIGSLWIDWWIIALIAFIVALLIRQAAWKSFLAGFLGIFLLWAILAMWIDSSNDGLLSSKIAMLLGIGPNSFLLILLTAFAGGLVGGFAAMTGSFLYSRKNSDNVENQF
jgi:hypothetical protein